MQINSHFRNIRKEILRELDLSTESIYIAVAWFTNHELFEKLCDKLKLGVKIELIIIDDEINNRKSGLNFQEFIKLGGSLFYGDSENPMHNKFCIIDNKVLITGSYNWTYFAESLNYENITIFRGLSDIILDFKHEFELIKEQTETIKVANQYNIHIENFKSVYDIRNYLATDIYQFALEEEAKGNKQNSLNLINLSLNLTPENKKYKQKRFEIRNVIYKQWNEDYVVDRIELNENETIIHFKTHIDNGAWLHSPSAKFAWKLRNTENINQVFSCNSIKNIAINGKLVLDNLPDISVLSFFEQKKTEEDKTSNNVEFNEQGYKITETGKAIDEKGRYLQIIDYEVNKNDLMTCEIKFPPLDRNINFVDLIEGIDAIDRTNHWHCFDIELNRNKIEK